VVKERQFLINDDAQAGDDVEDIDNWTVDNENSSVNFSKLIPCAEAGELVFISVQFQSVWDVPTNQPTNKQQTEAKT